MVMGVTRVTRDIPIILIIRVDTVKLDIKVKRVIRAMSAIRIGWFLRDLTVIRVTGA
jgi:hypothetical protein